MEIGLTVAFADFVRINKVQPIVRHNLTRDIENHAA